MEMKSLLAAELTLFGAFAVYLVFAQLDHMKKLRQRDQAKTESAEQREP